MTELPLLKSQSSHFVCLNLETKCCALWFEIQIDIRTAQYWPIALLIFFYCRSSCEYSLDMNVVYH